MTALEQVFFAEIGREYEDAGRPDFSGWHFDDGKVSRGALARCLQMAVSMSETKHDESPSLAQLVEKAIHDAKELARAEIALAKSEASAQLISLAGASLYLVASIMLAQAGITVLGVVLVLLVGPSPWGFVVVAGLLALAMALGILGIRAIKPSKPRTPARLAADAREIVEAIK